MLALATTAPTAFSAPALPLASGTALRAPAAQQLSMSAVDDLKALAKEQNPVVGYFDPFNLALLNFWGQGEEATVGFLRHAEIKHGRVAMAAFCGFCIQSWGLKFPWAPFDAITSTSPPEQWDALPESAKYQIVLFVGFLEVFSEHSFILEKQGQKHYMKGGKPGYFPALTGENGFGVHPVPFDLYDPLGFSKNATPEKKAKGLLIEVNNGRLAMIGIMGFLAESKVPGSVPFGPHLPQYSGEVMEPFNSAVWLH